MARILLSLLGAMGLLAMCQATCHTSADDCKVTYGPWSTCDPCTKIQSRHLIIATPPQFEGMPCPDSMVEHQSCVTHTPCPADLPCPGQFDCKFQGRCVNDSMVCNGDDDCGNNQDERNCTKSTFYERAIEECLNMPSLPYLDQIGSGVNLASSSLAGRVVDNQRFNGLCRKAFDGDKGTVYRMPYNVDNFHFAIEASDDLQVKSYNSLSDFTKELDKSSHHSWTESVNMGGAYELFSAKMSETTTYSEDTTFQSIFKAMKDTQSVLFKVSSTIQTGEFIMKESDLLLDNFFEQRLMKLPATFNAKVYFDFFSQYGAFYLHTGRLGGRYSHYYIFSSQQMKRSQQTTTTMYKCLKFSMSAEMGFGSFFHVGGSGGFDKCSSDNGTEVDSHSVSSSATHKGSFVNYIVHIKGGTTEAAGKLTGAALAGNGTFQESKYEAWVAGIQQNPILLDQTYRSVCDLFLSTKDPQKEAKHEVCLNATIAFMQKQSTTKCTTCKAGTPVNVGGQCQCACNFGYMGQTCSTYVNGPITAPHAIKKNVQMQRPTKAMSLGASDSPDTKPDVKFVTTGDVANNPPYMQWIDVGMYDTIIKMMEKKLFLLSSTKGIYTFNGKSGSGDYYIKEYDEFLKLVSSTKIDFTTFDDCNAGQGFCILRDFDVDSHYNFVLSVKVDQGQGTAIYKVYGNTNAQAGQAIMKIDRPCAMDDSMDSKTVYVSTTCTDQIVVSCPSMSPATVKVFTTDGEPEDLSQFAGFPERITGLQHFNDAVWVHTADNMVGAYDLESWQQIFNYTNLLPDGRTGGPLQYSQISVDFLGNLILGQAHNHENGMLNYKMTIIEGTSKQVLAYVKLDKWNYCADVATYRGKLYTLCSLLSDASKKAILVFDYLK